MAAKRSRNHGHCFSSILSRQWLIQVWRQKLASQIVEPKEGNQVSYFAQQI